MKTLPTILALSIIALSSCNGSNPMSQTEQEQVQTWEYYATSQCVRVDFNTNDLMCEEMGGTIIRVDDNYKIELGSSSDIILGEGNLVDGDYISVVWQDVEFFNDVKGELYLDSNGDVYLNFLKRIK